MEFGLPELTSSFLEGQDVFYTQFNEIEIYVEDIDQENLYFAIFNKVLNGVKFEKIFPLGGKKKVTEHSHLNLSNKKKIYIVDLDFDDILGLQKSSANLFYLRKYSIENYLLEYDAIKDIIIEEKPKIKENEIQLLFELQSFFNECQVLFSELMCYYLVIQKYDLGLDNVSNDTARFCNFNTTPASLKTAQISIFTNAIGVELKTKKPRMKLVNQAKSFKTDFNSPSKIVDKAPGKYLLNFLKYRISTLFALPNMNLESFTFRLAKKCQFVPLTYLNSEIEAFIKS